MDSYVKFKILNTEIFLNRVIGLLIFADFDKKYIDRDRNIHFFGKS
jgi:hypothetical protein